MSVFCTTVFSKDRGGAKKRSEATRGKTGWSQGVTLFLREQRKKPYEKTKT